MSGSSPKDVPIGWSVLSGLGLLGVLVLPIGFAMAGAGMVPAIAGALAWASSVAVKAALAPRLSAETLGATCYSALQGLLSAATELGAAAGILLFLDLQTVTEVLAFGAAAAASEMIYVIVKSAAAPEDARAFAYWLSNARRSFCVRYAVPIERWGATWGHMGSRGLVWVSLFGDRVTDVWPALLAFIAFAAVDAVAIYGGWHRWDWISPRTCRSAQLFFASAGLLELAIFLLMADAREAPWQQSPA